MPATTKLLEYYMCIELNNATETTLFPIVGVLVVFNGSKYNQNQQNIKEKNLKL